MTARSVGARLSVRDLAILTWIAEQQPVTADQVAEEHKLSRPIAYRRLRALRSLGYLRTRRLVHDRPALLTVTAAGQALTGLDSPLREITVEDVRRLLAT